MQTQTTISKPRSREDTLFTISALPGIRNRDSKDYFLWVGMILFRLALDLSYERFLFPIYRFDSPINFAFKVDVSRYLLSLFILFVYTTTLESKSYSMTNVFKVMTALFIVAPLTSEYGLNSSRPLEPVIYTMAALLVVELVSRIQIPQFLGNLSVPGGPGIAVGLSVLGVVYLLGWGYLSGAYRFFNLNVDEVYQYRSKVTALLDVGLLSYLNLWVYKVFTVFLVCVCLHRRRYGWLALVLACQVLFFGLTSHKIVLFLPLLAIVIWLYLGRINELAVMPVAAAFGVLALVAIYEITGIESIPQLIIRRAFYVPSGLTYLWFAYFDHHPHVYWADRLLAAISSGDYVHVSLPKLIGDYYVPGSDSAANSGMVSAGFAQAGLLGVGFYAVVLGLVLSVLNMIVRSGMPVWFVAAVTIGPLRTAIADSDLFTSILSHGLGLAAVLLWLYRGRLVPQGTAPARRGTST